MAPTNPNEHFGLEIFGTNPISENGLQDIAKNNQSGFC
jgi:hypothetical protein